jgi:antigen flippase
MSLAKASVWTAGSTLVKIGVGLLVVKLLAIEFGPEGVGQAGNFRQLITVLGVLSGAGIFNGITKYIAEYQQQPERMKAVVGTASTMILSFSALLAALFLLFSSAISNALFGHENYRYVIQILALIQMGIAYSNFILAILKGYRDAMGNALSIIAGSLLGVIAYMISLKVGGYPGALVGLALVPAMIVFPALLLLIKRKQLPLSYLSFAWDKPIASRLSRFTLMAVITCITLPVAYVVMRNLLAESYSWQDVGIWQGVTTISDAYLQFITASFTVYLLPTLSRLTVKSEITKELFQSLRFVLMAVAAVSFGIWLFRDLAIRLLFSSEFIAMRDLFSWQLIGDILKVGCYVFGYLVIAKASLKLYLLAEVSQFILLMVFSHWLIPLNGALGASQAYMATYVSYFILCCLAFYLYSRKP